jgi:ribokinase
MKKIAVIGSINMDMTAVSERIPRPGETISAKSLRYIPGGKGANQAVAASRLGGDVTMFGCVGDDAFGSKLIENLKDNGINTDHIRTISGESSGLAMIVVAENDNAITVIPGANASVSTEYIDSNWNEIISSDIILLQNEIPEETINYVINRLYTENKTIIYNPAPARHADKAVIDKVSFFTPNEHEARIVLGDDTTDIRDLIGKYNGKMIVTLGSKGVAGYDVEYIQIPAIKAKVVDTTGAGDTMNGAFAYALSAGMNYRDALVFANTAAGIATEKEGAQAGIPTRAEVENRL